MFPGNIQELLPEVSILNGSSLRVSPAPRLPLDGPFTHSKDKVLGIGDHLDLTRLVERVEGGQSRQKLHPLVGRPRLTPLDHPFLTVASQNGGIASGTWVSQTGAVGEDRDLFHGVLRKDVGYVMVCCLFR
jgi:hypothetical protein